MDNNTKEVIEMAMFIILAIATLYIINLSNRD
jgi:hypothetical protein